MDLGSGRGRDVLRMAEAVGASGHAFGIDTSEGMLEKARETATRLGVANASFLRADLQSLPLESESVDLVISNCTINHAADKQAVWNEIHRVLKPGGRFVVSDIYATREVPPEFATDAQAIAECWAGAVTREQYFRQLARAGFAQVEVREESDPYPSGHLDECREGREELPFADGSFDLVFLGHVLHEADDPQAALREARRVAGKDRHPGVAVSRGGGRAPLAHRLSQARVFEIAAAAGLSSLRRIELSHMDFYTWDRETAHELH